MSFLCRFHFVLEKFAHPFLLAQVFGFSYPSNSAISHLLKYVPCMFLRLLFSCVCCSLTLRLVHFRFVGSDGAISWSFTPAWRRLSTLWILFSISLSGRSDSRNFFRIAAFQLLSTPRCYRRFSSFFSAAPPFWPLRLQMRPLAFSASLLRLQLTTVFWWSPTRRNAWFFPPTFPSSKHRSNDCSQLLPFCLTQYTFSPEPGKTNGSKTKPI